MRLSGGQRVSLAQIDLLRRIKDRAGAEPYYKSKPFVPIGSDILSARSLSEKGLLELVYDNTGIVAYSGYILTKAGDNQVNNLADQAELTEVSG